MTTRWLGMALSLLSIFSCRSSTSHPPSESSTNELTRICDDYWNGVQPDGKLTDYGEYVRAINELHARADEVVNWSIERLSHKDYEAKAQAASLLGTAAVKNQLSQLSPEERKKVIAVLRQNAIKEPEADGKEVEANDAALDTLAVLSTPDAISACRTILTSPEWNNDDLQWHAMEVLGKVSNKDFHLASAPIEEARQWLTHNP